MAAAAAWLAHGRRFWLTLLAPHTACPPGSAPLCSAMQPSAKFLGVQGQMQFQLPLRSSDRSVLIIIILPPWTGWVSIAMATEMGCAGPLRWLKLSQFCCIARGICPNFLWELRPSTPRKRVPAAQGGSLRGGARQEGRTLMACSLLRPLCHQGDCHGPAAFTCHAGH